MISNKIILLDIDGTLCGRDNKVPLSAKKAVINARKNGNKIYLVTGRSLSEIYDDILDVGIDGIIGGNGSFVYVDGEMIFQKFMAEPIIKELKNWLDKNKIGYYLECNSGLYASRHFVSKSCSNLCNNNEVDNKRMLDITFPHMIYEEIDVSDVNKISFILDDYGQLEEAKKIFEHKVKVGSWGVFYHDQFGEFSNYGIDKVSSTEILLQNINSTWKDVIAFGDGEVDVGMIVKAEIGVAMGNARQSLKDVADYVCDDVDDNGLYKAFKCLDII